MLIIVVLQGGFQSNLIWKLSHIEEGSGFVRMYVKLYVKPKAQIFLKPGKKQKVVLVYWFCLPLCTLLVGQSSWSVGKAQDYRSLDHGLWVRHRTTDHWVMV